MDWNISLKEADAEVVRTMERIHTRTAPHEVSRDWLFPYLEWAATLLTDELADLRPDLDIGDRDLHEERSRDLGFARRILDVLDAQPELFDPLLKRTGFPVAGLSEAEALVDTAYTFWLATLIGPEQAAVFVEHVPVWLTAPDSERTVAPLGDVGDDPKLSREMLVSLAFVEACRDYHEEFNDMVNEVWDDDDMPGTFERAKERLRDYLEDEDDDEEFDLDD
jgi:hypothetical protein